MSAGMRNIQTVQTGLSTVTEHPDQGLFVISSVPVYSLTISCHIGRSPNFVQWLVLDTCRATYHRRQRPMDFSSSSPTSDTERLTLKAI